MKSSFVMLAGRSNVGKSTLLNALVGSKVAIVTPKPQTTRHPIRGILHDPRGQIVFVDTPGVFLGNRDRVSKKLNQFVEETLQGVDAIVYVMDPTREPGAEELHLQQLLRATHVPIIAVINKSDLPSPHLAAYKEANVGAIQSIDISARKRSNLNRLVDALFLIAPEGPAHYPDLQLTDMDHKKWLEELIREKIFLHLNEELPYSITVSLETITPRPNGSQHIEATIWTNADRYKGMIIGAKGAMLKKIGTAARKEIEGATNTKTMLELTVDVDPKWQERFV